MDGLRITVKKDTRHTLDSSDFTRDIDMINGEGVAASQEVFMRVQRNAMIHVLQEVEPRISTFGYRAGNALEMLKIMFSSRITATNTLNRDTLVNMGYVTNVVNVMDASQ